LKIEKETHEKLELLIVVCGVEQVGGGVGGHGGGHGAHEVACMAAAVAVAAQRVERNRCVGRDLALDLPTCLPLPDGEERPYGSSTRLRIRDYHQV